MANPFRACVRFTPDNEACQTFDWCTNIDLDTEDEYDLLARAGFFLAGMQARSEQFYFDGKPITCEYQIVIMTAFPGE